MYDPPPGYDDCEDDAERYASVTPITAAYREIDVPGVGTFHARRPMPNSIPALAKAASAKIPERTRIDQLDLFVQNHLAPGEFETLLARMMDPDETVPADSVLRVSRAIATAGTARPTRRSLASR
ncbi:hypothetical protein PBI_THONKO_38 [Mycobacterium phage Thonko]|uniref:Tail assembly chaperone n=1 Tax=Mycobacterium phage Thonko TaxID=2282910 RepID=A0A346FC85_9CAUD|nr:hypothetical protein I5G57_gp038 [Mycobacterium phage Thonko]AXN53310.1 hypothetical protein PBI_THONKO_38 [Mycobacterium phage Thonko]